MKYRMIDTAFILAAGRGSRMRPLVDDCPKPLVLLRNRPILDYVLDHLKNHGIRHLVINAYYLSDKVVEYGQSRAREFDTLKVCVEKTLLDTGGGLKNVAPYLKSKPFFMINGDAFWEDDFNNKIKNESKPSTTLSDLEAAYNSEDMDVLLNLINVNKMRFTKPVGDYDIDSEEEQNGTTIKNKNRAQLIIRNEGKAGKYMFTGIRIVHPRVLDCMQVGAYSFLNQMDEAQSKRLLYGYVMKGHWHHISTAEDVYKINAMNSV